MAAGQGYYAVRRSPLIEEAALTVSRLARTSRALLIAGTALVTATACGAGISTQTANQVAAVPGANADAATISLRGVMVAYNGPQGYPIGGSAPLLVRIFNNGSTTARLTGVSAPGSAARVELVTDTGPPPAEETATPAPSEGASAEATPSPPSLSVEIKPASYAMLIPGNGAYLQLVDLTRPLMPGESVRVTFTFDTGAVEVVVPFVG